jgi:peroxiredoxin
MRSVLAIVAAVLVLAAAVPALAVKASVAPGAHPLAVGDPFPDVALPGTLSPEAASYLGLAAGRAGQPLSKVAAEVLVVEVFSMYCPFCQVEAPEVNALFALIDKRGLSNRVKIIGIGAGNSETEVDIFRKKYAVPFPLFADADFAAHKRMGEVGTPFFYILKKRPDGGYAVASASLGQFDSPAEFLSLITRTAGI